MSTEPTGGPAPAPSRLRRHLRVWLPGLAAVLAPLLVTLLLFHFWLGASLLDCAPIVSDEVGFWLEIATFREAGFNGGYNSTNEQVAPAGFCRFDPRGPGYPVLYGLLAVVLGWEPWSGAVFHLLWLAAATAVWLWVCRPGPWQLAAVTLVIATFWPCLLYLPSPIQEGLHCAFAFLIAAAVQRSFTAPPGSPGRFVAPLLVIAACALVRATWVLVLLPWALLWMRGHSTGGRIWRGVAVAALFCAVVSLSHWLAAPHVFSDGIGLVPWLLYKMRESPTAAALFFFEHVASNLRNFVSLDSGRPLEVLQRYVILGSLLWIAVALWWGRGDGEGDRERRRRRAFAGLNLAVLTGAVILAYDVKDWRDYRVLGPHLLLSVLVLAGGPGWRWVLVPGAAHLLFLPAFLAQYEKHHLYRVGWDQEEVRAFRAELRDVRFDPSGSGWDNTILIPAASLTYPMMAVPPGMGVNCVVDWPGLKLPPRSRYLLLPQADMLFLYRGGRLRPLRLTRMGWLCINLDADPRADDGRPAASDRALEERLHDDRDRQ